MVGMLTFGGGQASAAGLSSQRVVAIVNVPANSSGSVTAACPAGTLRTGGGWYGSTALSIRNNDPLGSSQWIVAAQNTGNATTSLAAFAVCLSGSGGSVSAISGNLVMVAPWQFKSATATCPNGTLLTGGGFSATGADTRVSKPNGSGWEADLWNTGSFTLNLTAYVVCLSAANANMNTASATVSVLAGSDESVAAICEPGEALTGGGYSSTIISSVTDLFLIHGSYPGLSPIGMLDRWFAVARNNYTFPQSLTSYALCAH